MNRLMWPFAQVCQRARVKATAASVAIRAGTAGWFVLAASERDGGAPELPGSAGPSGTAEPATRARAAGCS